MTRRDEQEFVEFVSAHQGRLRRAAFLITGDWAAADDVTQEALVRLYVALPRLGYVESLLGYARRTVVNVAIDAARKRGTRERYEARESLPPPLLDTLRRSLVEAGWHHEVELEVSE